MTSGRGISVEGACLFLMFMGTAVLSLRGANGESLLPHAPYAMLALQLVCPLLVAGYLRLRLGKSYEPILVVVALLGLLGSFSLASAYWSSYPELVVQRSLLVFVPLLIVVALAWSDANPRTTFVLLGQGLVFFVSVLSAIGVFLYFFGVEQWIADRRVQAFSVLAQPVYGIAPFLRISSLAGNPNTLASWIASGLVLNLYLLNVHRVQRALGIMAFVLQLLALVLTFSRTGVLVAVIACGTYLLGTRRNMGISAKHLFSVFLLAAALLCVVLVRRESIPIFNLNQRGEAWATLVRSFLDRPMTGVGFGVSVEAALIPSGLEMSGHNGHLQILAETGIPGYLAFMLPWLTALLVSGRRMRVSALPEERATLGTVFSLLLALLIHQLAEGAVLRYGFRTLHWGYLLIVGCHPGVRRSRY